MQGDDWDNGSMKRFGLPMDDRTGDGTFASGLLHRRGGVHPAGGPRQLWLDTRCQHERYRKETNAQHSHSETRIDRSLLLFLLEQDKA